MGIRSRELKPGWQMWRFDQIAAIVNDRIDDPSKAGVERYVGLEHLDSDSLKIRRWGSPSDVEATKLIFRKGDIIFGRRRAYQRKLAVADFDGICSAHAMVLRARPHVVLPDFLPFFMQSDLFMNRALEISVGSLSPTINWKTLAQQEFALPPLEEQRRMAELLWASEQVCSTTLDALATAQSLRKTVQAESFKDVLQADRSQSSVAVGEIFEQVTEKGFSELPILSVTISGQIVRRVSLERHVSDDTGEGKYIRVLPGDLAYNTMRLWQGAIGVVREEGLISPAYTVVRLVDRRHPIDYFASLFRSPRMLTEYRRYVKGVASDRWRLYFKDLSSIQLQLPAPEKTAEIAERLCRLDELTQTIGTRHNDSAALKKSLVTQFLGGDAS